MKKISPLMLAIAAVAVGGVAYAAASGTSLSDVIGGIAGSGRPAGPEDKPGDPGAGEVILRADGRTYRAPTATAPGPDGIYIDGGIVYRGGRPAPPGAGYVLRFYSASSGSEVNGFTFCNVGLNGKAIRYGFQPVSIRTQQPIGKAVEVAPKVPIASFDPKEAKAIRKAARIEWAKAQGCYPACGLKALLGEAQNFAQWAAESEDVQALVAAGLIEEGTAATG